MNLSWERFVYRFGWDTRSRNFLPARLLRPLLTRSPRTPLLDVGCGSLGLSAFLSGQQVVGIDLEAPAVTNGDLSFALGSILALPFASGSFPVVSCIDVLEHLPLADRARAIAEIVRVASRTVMIACPHGPKSQACDAEFRRAATEHGRPLPGWVEEHLRQSYPEAATIIQDLENSAALTGRQVRISSFYCEPIMVSRLIRYAASRSNLMYLAVNLWCGIFLPLLPAPKADDSYRTILLASFTEKEPLVASSA